MSRKLVITDGTRERELQLVGRLVVGRDPSCDISHDHSLLSRRHAEFVTSGQTVTVRDLGSRNGVFVNGNRAGERKLDPGDVVQIGPIRARYLVDDAPVSIIPEALDADRTAMLRPPDAAAASAAPIPTPATAAMAAPVLEDTVVSHGPADEDVTRMVPAPAPPRSAPRADVPAVDDEATSFRPGPAAPDLEATVVRPAPAAPAALSPPPPASSGQEELSRFVLVRALLLALVAVSGTVAAGALVPGVLGLLLALLIAGGAAVVVAGIITGRVASAGDRG